MARREAAEAFHQRVGLLLVYYVGEEDHQAALAAPRGQERPRARVVGLDLLRLHLIERLQQREELPPTPVRLPITRYRVCECEQAHAVAPDDSHVGEQ